MFGMEKQSLPQHSPYVPSPHHFIFWRKSTKKHFFVEKGFLMVCKKVFPPMFSNVSFISSLGVRAPLLCSTSCLVFAGVSGKGGAVYFFLYDEKSSQKWLFFFWTRISMIIKKTGFFLRFPPLLDYPMFRCFASQKIGCLRCWVFLHQFHLGNLLITSKM